MEFNIGKHVVSFGLEKLHDFKLGLSARWDTDGQYLQLLASFGKVELVTEIQWWL